MANVLPTGMRLAIYARVSTEEQKEGQTIDSQIAELERHARESGWEIREIYRDEGWSGAVMARPALDRLRDDARKGIFQAVLINDVDRLARDVAHLGVIKRDLERSGVRVIFRKLPSETSPTHNLMVNILGSFAEFERELIADRTRRGRRYKVEVKKEFLGCMAPYGFRYIPKEKTVDQKGYLELNPDEAHVVKQMFDWVSAEGLSARKVVERLNQMKLPTRKGSSIWWKSSVLRILHCEIYAGRWHYNKFQSYEPITQSKQPQYRKHLKSALRQRPKHEWIPLDLPKSMHILDRAQWLRVQEQLNKNICFSIRNGKHPYLLKGLVRCAGCSSTYVGEPCHGKFYYRCAKRCKQVPTVKEDVLNEPVWEAIEEVILHPQLIESQVKRTQDRLIAEASKISTEQQQVEQGMKQIQAEEVRFLEAYRLEVISPGQLGQELEKINARKNSLQARQAELATPRRFPSWEIVKRSIHDYCDRVARNIRSFDEIERQKFLRSIIKEIVFDGNKVSIAANIPLIVEEDDPTRFTENPNHPPVYPLDGLRAWPLNSRVFIPAIGVRMDKPIIRVRPPLPARDAWGKFVSNSESLCTSSINSNHNPSLAP